MLVRMYVRPSQFKGQLVTRIRVTRGNMQIQSKERRTAQYAQALEFLAGLDSTMNLDALSVQCYKAKEAKEERKKERNMVNGYWRR